MKKLLVRTTVLTFCLLDNYSLELYHYLEFVSSLIHHETDNS